MVYLGVDLHRKVSHVVALDEAGNVTLSRRLVNDPAESRRVFGELEPEPIEVAFEATYGWGWFADLLADAGVAAHMAHPLATKAIGAGRVKNDAIDARTLAHLLRTNLLPEAPFEPRRVRKLDHAALMYSWTSPPRRSRRSMSGTPSASSTGARLSGTWSSSPRCGRRRL